MFTRRYDPGKTNSKAEDERKAAILEKLRNKKTQNGKSDLKIVSSQQIQSVIQEEKKEHDLKDVEMEDVLKDEDESTLKRKRDDNSSDDESSDESDEEPSDNLSSESEEEGEEEEEEEEEKDENKSQDSASDEDVEMADVKDAHKSVLSRFKTVMQKQTDLPTDSMDTDKIDDEEHVEVKDVAPLPQLRLPKDRQLYAQLHKNKNLDWLTKPAYYDSALSKPFTDFKPSVHDTLLKNLDNEFQIKDAFSVQITLIEELLKDIKRGRLDPVPRGDYLINAATGSGKTLAYLVPIVQHILGVPGELKIKDSGIKAVIIVPTKPLVQQVYADALKLTKGTDINVMALKSGGDISISEERNKLKSNLMDVLITTPGRLVEHLENIDFKVLRFLIVDEADRLLNQNFQDWCDLVMNKIESTESDGDRDIDSVFKLKVIKIVLSATLTTNSEKLTHLRLFKPRLVIVNSDDTNELYQLPRTLDEKVITVTEKLSQFKPLILLRFFQWIDKLGNKYDNSGIIFTKSNESTIRLTKLLNLLVAKLGLDLKIGCINSMMDNQDRAKALKNLDDQGGLLICTDLLSRGINLTSVKFVINYDLPGSTKEYIHRIGRTARAGHKGTAITLCYGEGEFKWFKRIVYSGKQINRNGKEITDVKFVKDKNDVNEEDQRTADYDIFELNMGDDEKEVYETCLKSL